VTFHARRKFHLERREPRRVPIKSKSLQTNESPSRPAGAGFLFCVVIPSESRRFFSGRRACLLVLTKEGPQAGNLLFVYTSSIRAFCLRCARRKFHPERRKPRRVPIKSKSLQTSESPSRPTGAGFLFFVVIPSESRRFLSGRRGICCSSILLRSGLFVLDRLLQ